jgi:PPM family protein phosphatase
MTAETVAAQLLIGQSQAQGGRTNMEDRLAVRTVQTAGGLPLLVAMIADGIGGSNCGEVAAQMALDIVFEEIERAPVADPNQVPRLLARALKRANDAVFAEARADKAKDGMGTTATVVAVHEQKVYLANVGDSRAYLLRNGRLHQLTVDHTWEREMVRQGHLSREEAAVHPKAEALVRSIGYSDHLDVDLGLYLNGDDVEERAQLQQGLALKQNDRLLLCSDGLIKERHTGQGHYVEASEIVQIITRYAPEKAAQTLVKKAVSRRADDNVSAVVLETPGSQRAAASSFKLWSWLVGIILIVLAVGGFIFFTGLGPGNIEPTTVPIAAAPATVEPAATTTAVPTLDSQSEAIEATIVEIIVNSEGLYLGEEQLAANSTLPVAIPQQQGDGLKTGADSPAHLHLPDGTELILGLDTSILIMSVTNQGASEIRIQLEHGILLVNARNQRVVVGTIFHEAIVENALFAVEFELEPLFVFSVSCLEVYNGGGCRLVDNGKAVTLGREQAAGNEPSIPTPITDYSPFATLAPAIVPTLTPTPTPMPTPTPSATPTARPRIILTPTPTESVILEDFLSSMSGLRRQLVNARGILHSVQSDIDNEDLSASQAMLNWCDQYMVQYRAVVGNQTHEDLPEEWLAFHDRYRTAIENFVETNEIINNFCDPEEAIGVDSFTIVRAVTGIDTSLNTYLIPTIMETQRRLSD